MLHATCLSFSQKLLLESLGIDAVFRRFVEIHSGESARSIAIDPLTVLDHSPS